MERFIDALHHFSRRTKYMEFFGAHEETFVRVIADARRKIEGSDYIGTLEDYYGIQQNSYDIVLALLFHPGGFASRVRREHGTYDIYSIWGPKDVVGGIPTFGTVQEKRGFVRVFLGTNRA